MLLNEVTTTLTIDLNTSLLPLNLNSTDYVSDDYWKKTIPTLEQNFTLYENSSEVLKSNVNNSNSRNRGSRNLAIFYPIIITEMIFSILGLIATIFVYSILPEFRNVHGKNLISLSSCLLTTFSFLILDLAIKRRLSRGVCFAFAIITHISFLGTFFWTQVMAYDIWRTMSKLKPKKSEVRNSDSKKYLKYSIYAWSATALTALPAVILDQTDLVSESYRPQFGMNRCWLSGKTAFIMYFNAPVGILLFFNLVMFLLTMKSLLEIKKMTTNQNIKQHQKRFYLYLKLFLVMGIIWTTEFLPWATGIYKLYALAGILTALHGVLLFIIFVCKRRILKQVCEKLNIPCCAEGSATTTPKKSFSTAQSTTLSNSSSFGSVTKV